MNLLSFSLHSYDFYNFLALWPAEVRGDLRAGIKARNQEDFALSERYLRRYVPLIHHSIVTISILINLTSHTERTKQP